MSHRGEFPCRPLIRVYFQDEPLAEATVNDVDFAGLRRMTLRHSRNVTAVASCKRDYHARGASPDMSNPPWRDDPNFGGRPSLPGEELDGANRYRPRPFQAELNARDRHGAAIAAILLAPLVIDVPMAAIMRGGLGRREPEFIFMLAIVSISVAKFCLLAIWLAWGGSRLIWRVIVVFASLLFTCFAFAYDAHATEGYSAVLLACAAIAGASAIPKLFGVRWVSENAGAGSAGAIAAARPARQFTLVDMFIWTATVAVVAGVIRWLGFPREPIQMHPVETLLTVGCTLGYPSAGTLLTMWAALAPSPNVGPRCVIAWFVMIGLMSPFLLMIAAGARQEAGVALLIIVGAMSSTMFLVFAPLLVLRNWGHRLVRERRPPFATTAYRG
jgi:hypothetical protein